MRIAFYAPLKAPTHGTPSGDRRVAGLLMDALAHAGHRVELVSTFRSYDASGDPQRQSGLRAQGLALARQFVEQWRALPGDERPGLWFTYHLYYKAPDWLGPEVSAALGIPYVVAEASNAPKRAAGPWAIGHEGALDAIRRADLLLSLTQHDAEGLREAAPPGDRIVLLPPFLDVSPYRRALAGRGGHRAALAAAQGLEAELPWIVVAAMMRPGDKLASFRALAASLARLDDLPWRLLVAGDGPARADVEAALAPFAPRLRMLGRLPEAALAGVYAACDLCVWPAHNEAFGMAMLEAQAAGVPVVSCRTRGVPDVVSDGETGLLVPEADPQALANAVRTLIEDRDLRARMGHAAADFVAHTRDLAAAARRINAALDHMSAARGVRT